MPLAEWRNRLFLCAVRAETALIPTVATPPVSSGRRSDGVQLPQPPASRCCTQMSPPPPPGRCLNPRERQQLRRASSRSCALRRRRRPNTAQRRQASCWNGRQSGGCSRSGSGQPAGRDHAAARPAAARLDAEVCRDSLTARRLSARLRAARGVGEERRARAGDEAAAARRRRRAAVGADAGRRGARAGKAAPRAGRGTRSFQRAIIEAWTMLRAVEADLLVARAEAASAVWRRVNKRAQGPPAQSRNNTCHVEVR